MHSDCVCLNKDINSGREVRTFDIFQDGSHHRQTAQDLCKFTLLASINGHIYW